MYMTCKVGVPKGSTTKHASIFWRKHHILAAYLGFCVGGVPHVPKNVDGGPIKWLFLKREKKMVWCTSSLKA
jgi:hypothetical protein